MKFYKLLKSKILEQGKEKKNVRNYYRYFIGSLVNRVGNIQYIRRHSAPFIGNCSGSLRYTTFNRKKSSLISGFEFDRQQTYGCIFFTQPRFGFEARFFSLLNHSVFVTLKNLFR